MSFILPAPESGASRFMKGLESGFTQSFPQSISDMFKSHQKQKQLSQILGTSSTKPDVFLEGSPPSASGVGMEITPEKILALHQVDPQLANTFASLYKGQEKQKQVGEQKAQEKELGQRSFDQMANLLNSGRLGLGSKAKGALIGGKTAESVGEFESLSGALESMLVDRVSRGTLSNARFKYITEILLPKPNDRQATIRGKMKALARELDLDPGALLKKSSEEKAGDKNMAKDFVLMRDPQGNIRQIPKNRALEAQKAGGKLVK